MIRGVHTMFYSSDAEGLREFLRDKLNLPFTDVGQGWLIFDVPEAEMGCHPADMEKGAASGRHDISFYCDEIERTVAELQARGVEFTAPVADHGYGLVTFFKLPGDFQVQLYQPRYVKTTRPPSEKPAPRPAARAGKKPVKAARRKPAKVKTRTTARAGKRAKRR